MDGICIIYWRIKYLAKFDKSGQLMFIGKVPSSLPFGELRYENQKVLMDGQPISLPFYNTNRGLLIVRFDQAVQAFELFETIRDEMKEFYDNQSVEKTKDFG